MPGDRPFATITAGWQEREADDGELTALLSGRAVNLGLHQRWLDVQDSDPEYAADERRLRGTLAELQDVYLVRLDYALRAVYALQSHSGQDWLLAGGVAEAIAAVRDLDTAHLHRVNEARGEFFQRWQPHDRPVIAGHRAAVSATLAGSAGLIVAGGHVGVLAEVLHLFNVAAALRPQAPGWPVIAWSAGAMALAERIVLFGDRSPQGPGHPEIYGSGLSVLREVILLPHARTRLLLHDRPRMAVFARRFVPARCILLDNGTRLDQGSDGTWPPGTRVLAEDGHVTALEAA
jgi:Peptidase family S51